VSFCQQKSEARNTFSSVDRAAR